MVKIPCQTAPFDARALRNAFAEFATGVTVIAARGPDGTPVGLTANSFSSVSLEPALVLWCLGRDSRRFSVFNVAETFTINILSADQQAVSDCCASSGEIAEVAELETLATGAPALKGACARFDCALFKRVEAGDHVVLIGEVLAFDQPIADSALTFFRGRYGRAG
ncbi:MAG: flavin reductase family protein [Maricaulaceae bacterium]